MKNIVIIATIIVFVLLVACEAQNITANIPGPPTIEKKINFGTNFDKKYSGTTIEDVERRIDTLSFYGVEKITIYKVLYLDGVDDICFHESFPSDNPFWLNYSNSELSEIAAYARSKNITVRMGLDICPLGYDYGSYMNYKEVWRGYIEPSNIHYWFDNLKPYVIELGRLCQRQGIQTINLGDELVSMTKSRNDNEWKAIIDTLRSVYSGKVTYCFNGGAYNKDSHSLSYFEFNQVSQQFYDLFDELGITIYPNLSSNTTPTIDSSQTELGYIMETLYSINATTGKKVFIGETSCPSVDSPLSSNYVSWAWDTNVLNNKNLNEDAQANYVTALINVTKDKNWFSGTFWHNSYYNQNNSQNNNLLNKGPSPFRENLSAKKMLQQVKILAE